MNDEAREFVIRGVLRSRDGFPLGEWLEEDFLRWVAGNLLDFEGSIGLPLVDQAADDYEAYGPA